MSPVVRFGREKLRTRTIIAAVTLTIAAVAFLLLRNSSAPVRPTPLAAGPSHQAADTQVASDPAEAEQAAAAEGPMELPVMYLNPDGTPASGQISEMPLSGSPQPMVSTDLEDHTSSAARQRMFKSRRAVEIINPLLYRR